MTYDEICKFVRPSDYVDGHGLSVQGEKVAARIALADWAAEATDHPEADASWGHLTPEAQASDDNQWNQMLLEGKL